VRDNLRWWLLERLTRGAEQEVRFALPEHHGEVLQTALLALPDLAHLHLDVRLRLCPPVASLRLIPWRPFAHSCSAMSDKDAGI
jgi:hypothetical protein